MPRQQRIRHIRSYPNHWCFSPEDADASSDTIILSLDEYEVIRLLDKEHLTQEQCAGQMGVSRPTVTAIYESARSKLAQVIVDGKKMVISGGQYQLTQNIPNSLTEKGEQIMRIAVTYENEMIFQHFGHSAQFKLYDVANKEVISSQIVDTKGNGHGALAGFLKQSQVDALICGGIGMGAQNALEEAGIRLYGGVTGNADQAVQALLQDRLSYNPNANCDHHGEHHHGEGHTCGNHGCGH